MEPLTECPFNRLDSTALKIAQLQGKLIFCAAITLKDQIVREINFQVAYLSWSIDYYRRHGICSQQSVCCLNITGGIRI